MSDVLSQSAPAASDASGSTSPSGSLAAHGPVAERSQAVSSTILLSAVQFLEFGLLSAAGALAYILYILPGLEIVPAYLMAVPVVAAMAVAAASRLGAYSITALRSLTFSLWRIAAAWAAAMLVMLALAFFLKAGAELSRAWVGLWLAVGLAALLAERLTLRACVRGWSRDGRLDRHAVVVGGGETAATLIRALEKSKTADIRIVGLFDDRGADRIGFVAHYPTLGSIDDLVAFARKTRVDLLIIALPLTAEARLLQLLRKLWVLPVDIRISALSSRLRFRPRAYSYIGDVPFVDLFDKPLSGWDVVKKAVFDRVVGAIALVLLSPVMLVTALAVKLDSKGPALFRQKRYGFNNELIEVYKFRSMYTNQSDATASKLVTKGDPRVTRIGRFIRKSSLDELPQLFNVVFKGDLSLVGPRPHAVHAKAANHLYQDVVDGYYARHKVKPGITGWAQVNGWRGETDTPEKIQRRVECDLHYIENWSVLFDLYIMAITPLSLITKSENAY